MFIRILLGTLHRAGADRPHPGRSVAPKIRDNERADRDAGCDADCESDEDPHGYSGKLKSMAAITTPKAATVAPAASARLTAAP